VFSLDWIYYAISWILLAWHSAWDAIGVPDAAVIGTNWAWILAIVFLVVTVRVILFPVFVKQIKSQRAMQALQPKVKELQEKHKGDRETLQKEMMELYRSENVNPLMGCLPLFLQIPVFISLFWVLRRLSPTRELKTDLYTWTHDQFISASNAELFGAPIAAQFFDDKFWRFAALGSSITNVRIVTGVLVVLMMVTTYLTAKQMVLKTGWATEPTQLMMQRLMVYGLPFMLLFSGAFFPLGVILYWVVQNLFSLGQQQWVLRKYPPPQVANTAGLIPTGGDKQSGGGKSAGGKDGKAGKASGKAAKGGKGTQAEQPPAIDGRKLAPKPGAKPVRPQKRTPPSQSIPPKRNREAPRKG
jgi:YidC/Oxa1 family membrane protein insertase